ncbi:exo-beta-N-acetylmuramidase NamZ family protein [Crocinitomix catalasitica]|uniref:exo-beta-N-acetylmuramidase NamZ family protein n=1 Tax=Crocinitomix catalasitica TaxID=184607 RepID=UPI00047F0F25|nr:DUF1343 domain-containing protein [Crocinitomix catalasitica]
MIKVGSLILIIVFVGCSAKSGSDKAIQTDSVPIEQKDSVLKNDIPLYANLSIQVGAEKISDYLPMLENKRIAIVGNQSSIVNGVHLVDTLFALNVKIKRIFSPEHGFRGDADAGEKVDNDVDSKTGLPIVSLYGKNKKPYKSQLTDVDIILFDIQDVGVRFYTYISTLHLVMEAAAENGIKVIVLDRPNPNGHYVAGPVLDLKFESFIGKHTVPVVHGMTVGEYAQMINGESWLPNKMQCELTVVACSGWDHNKFYELPIAPSPNLPNMESIYLYPSLCFFEGTEVSIGRGTDWPFQVIGHPDLKSVDEWNKFNFIPAPNFGAKNPKLNGKECFGIDLHERDIVSLRQGGLDLSFLLDVYNSMPNKEAFFLNNGFINLLAGSDQLKKQIEANKTIAEIEATWQDGIAKFRDIRQKYLLYSDFK